MRAARDAAFAERDAALAARALLAAIEAAARDGMVPPKRMWAMIGGPDDDYVGTGQAQINLFISKGLVNPHSAVLDIGCGLGRLAIHFAEYLRTPGIYQGFDVEPLRIYWCHKAIEARYPHLHFQFLPIRNTAYNPDGVIGATELRFPYTSEQFDFVILGSVFTHMLAEDVENYIREIARVLRPGGKVYASLYLLNESAKEGIAAGTSAFTFAIPHGGCWVETADRPEAAVSHDESRILGMFAAAALAPSEPISYGQWRWNRQQLQDVVVFEKLP